MGRVRLSGGAFRGRTLPVGPGVRPTEGRVREALFSIWHPYLDGARVLDLFAGSGAVGIEAVGRGAAGALLVDGSPPILRQLKSSVSELDLADRVVVRRLDLPSGLARLVADGERFDLVFADPPYDFVQHSTLLAGLVGLVASDGLVVLEHRGDLPIELESESNHWECVDRRVYGECGLTFLQPLAAK
ncbi:MAG: 16S rRNA (guanine(966)-N(2))-methyltransferase RsmD [Thermoanaerobaculia bacterium]|nr:16S rRNA (guanine(966)-N(2))-methyltransferase RsmD [Thermoanaerobaculia bacterium]